MIHRSISEYFSPYTLQKVEVDGKEGYVLIDREGYYKGPDEGIDIALKLLLAYGDAGIQKALDDENKSIHLENMGFDFQKTGRYVRHGKPVYKRGEFDLFKRVWSFHCGFCGKKVSIDVQPEYWYIVDQHGIRKSNTLSDRACSEICAKHIWDEYLELWLKNNRYSTELGK
ncbi:hypothetical protein [Paenibacillus xylanivorans]|uniref:Uncharacterized protein n=1 Tax=Paenibacillus xylanivorans TaxID=1705561 RepID=A0A0N0C544_9BACL|nr:hypothetical protein [Paenibacillus xylanivorans]KOY16717.1 hypothetical protein AMS66_09960 [Paenibacillus xylanivorans]